VCVRVCVCVCVWVGGGGGEGKMRCQKCHTFHQQPTCGLIQGGTTQTRRMWVGSLWTGDQSSATEPKGNAPLDKVAGLENYMLALPS
jgi:hypothetical protein